MKRPGWVSWRPPERRERRGRQRRDKQERNRTWEHRACLGNHKECDGSTVRFTKDVKEKWLKKQANPMPLTLHAKDMGRQSFLKGKKQNQIRIFKP